MGPMTMLAIKVASALVVCQLGTGGTATNQMCNPIPSAQAAEKAEEKKEVPAQTVESDPKADAVAEVCYQIGIIGNIGRKIDGQRREQKITGVIRLDQMAALGDKLSFAYDNFKAATENLKKFKVTEKDFDACDMPKAQIEMGFKFIAEMRKADGK